MSAIVLQEIEEATDRESAAKLVRPLWPLYCVTVRSLFCFKNIFGDSQNSHTFPSIEARP